MSQPLALAREMHAALEAIRARRVADEPAAVAWPSAPAPEHFAVEPKGEHLTARLLLDCRVCCDGWISEGGYAAPCRCRPWESRGEEFNRARLPAGALGHTMAALDRSRFINWGEVRAALWDAAQGKRGALLTGGCGAGKSHLAAATVRVATLTCGLSARWSRWPDVLGSMRAAMRDKASDPEAVLDGLTRARLLVLDELGGEKGSEWTADALTRVLSQAGDRGCTVVATSNYNADDLGRVLGERSASRLAALCPEVRVQAADYRRSGR